MLKQSLLFDLEEAVRSVKDRSDFSARAQAAMEIEATYTGRKKSGPKYPDRMNKPVESKGKALLQFYENGRKNLSPTY